MCLTQEEADGEDEEGEDEELQTAIALSMSAKPADQNTSTRPSSGGTLSAREVDDEDEELQMALALSMSTNM